MTKLIGIAGGTSSGKTTIANKLYNITCTEGTVSMIRLDDYYKNYSHLSFEERAKINYDHPETFDIDLLLQHINLLMNNQSIEKPTYDYVNHLRSDVVEVINPSDVLIIEGITTFTYPELVKILDYKIFVDTPDDIRLLRRLKRDINKRGRTMESVIEQYLETVRPMHLTFVEPSKKYADIIIPEGGHNSVAIDVLATKIKDLLKK